MLLPESSLVVSVGNQVRACVTRDDPFLVLSGLHMRFSDMRALFDHTNLLGIIETPDSQLTHATREAFITALERGVPRAATRRAERRDQGGHAMSPLHPLGTA
jgi:hypothetical protein